MEIGEKRGNWGTEFAGKKKKTEDQGEKRRKTSPSSGNVVWSVARGREAVVWESEEGKEKGFRKIGVRNLWVGIVQSSTRGSRRPHAVDA